MKETPTTRIRSTSTTQAQAKNNIKKKHEEAAISKAAGGSYVRHDNQKSQHWTLLRIHWSLTKCNGILLFRSTLRPCKLSWMEGRTVPRLELFSGCHEENEREREGESERQTDRQTETDRDRQRQTEQDSQTARQPARQPDRQRARQPDSQTASQTARQPDSQTARQPASQPGKQADRQTGSQAGRQADRERQTERQTERDRQRQTETQTETDRHTDRHRRRQTDRPGQTRPDQTDRQTGAQYTRGRAHNIIQLIVSTALECRRSQDPSLRGICFGTTSSKGRNVALHSADMW